MDLASKLFKGDRVIWVIFMFLCLVSVIEVFSATSTIAYKNANHWAPIVRHATFLLGGFVLVLLMHNIPCRFYSLLSLLLPVSMVLLAITPFVGVVVNGEPRWLEILGIRFQPSEIAKIAAIGYTAFILSKRNWFTDKQMFWYILGGVGGVCFLIFFNNGSTAILLFAVTFMMMFIGQISIGRLLRLGGAGIIGVLMLVGFIRFAPDKVIDLMPDRVHTWKARIERFSDPADAVKFEPGRAVSIDGDDYQVVHAKIALARGGLFGKFPGHGQQRDFLPQAYSDFIYAIIIEEMGIVGAELDAEFAVKYFDEGKKIEECCAYIISEMEKMAQNNVVGATDDEVYGLAVRYYLEDVKVVDTKIGNHVRIVCNQIIELTEEEKEEARQKAIRQYQEEELHKLQSRKKPAVKKEIQVQPSLFDSQYETSE